jgi:hypothetical protein
MRASRRTLVVLLVLAGLFVGADRVAVYLAEQEAAERIRSARGLAGVDSASVSIEGFPFLTQVLGKNLDEVNIELTGMTAEAADRRIPVTRLAATLTDVRLADGYSSATAEHATGTAEISYADLNKIAPDGIEVSYAGDERAGKDQVKIVASVDILDREIEVPHAIYSSVEVSGDSRLSIHADAVPGMSIPGAEAQIRKRVDFDTEVGGMPVGFALEDAEVTKNGVRFTLSGENVPFG